MCFFSTFVSHLFRAFLSHFQNTVFPCFPSAFSNKTCEKFEKMRFENALGKNGKNSVLKM